MAQLELNHVAEYVCFFCSKRKGTSVFSDPFSGQQFHSCGRCAPWDEKRKLDTIRRGVGGYPPEKPKAPQCAGFVYFIGNHHVRMVKIGWAASPLTRMSELQSGSYVKLSLLGIITSQDPLALERSLHVKFNHLRERGEWFNLEAELLDFICKEATK